MGGSWSRTWSRLVGRSPSPGPRPSLWRRWPVLLLALVLVAVVTVTVVWTSSPGTEAACGPMTELRVLTTPQMKDPLTTTAAHFEQQEVDATGCRLVHVTVYSGLTGTTAETLQAFGQAGLWDGIRSVEQPSTAPSTYVGTAANVGTCAAAAPPEPSPGGSASSAATAAPPVAPPAATAPCPDAEVGPQPDIWIPASTVELSRAQDALDSAGASEVVTLAGDHPSVAYSPIVLAVPGAAAGFTGVDRTGRSLQSLVASAAQNGRKVVRSNPTTSDIGLLATVALYGVDPAHAATAQNAAAEQQLAAPGSLQSDEVQDLLCAVRLAKTAELPPVIVSEQALIAYNRGSPLGANCASVGPTQPLGGPRALTAYYPSDTAGLDYPFVPVTWRHDTADQAARTRATNAFRAWLLGPGGQGDLAAAGFRHAGSDSTAEPLQPTGAPFTQDNGVFPEIVSSAPSPDATQVQTALAAYQSVHAPGDVLFALDLSGSMNDSGRLASAVQAIRQALAQKGPRDRYGLVTFPTAADPGAISELVPPGTTDPTLGRQQLATYAGTALPNGLALYDGIGQALNLLSAPQASAPTALVVFTDGDDPPDGNPAGTRDHHTIADIAAQIAQAHIPVFVIAFPGTLCGPPQGGQNLSQLTDASPGGQCLDGATASQQVSGAVAGVWAEQS